MFWYLHPFKTCKSVPISLKHIRLGAKHIRLGAHQVPHSLYPNHRVESESKTYLYHGTTQTFARDLVGFFQITDRSEVGSGKAFMAPKRSLSTGGGGEASASRGKRAPRVGEGAASRGVDGAVSRSAQSLQQAASHLAGGKGARGGAGNGSEDGGSSGSDGGAVGRVASERHRTPEQQVCLSLDSVCNGAPGLIAL